MASNSINKQIPLYPLLLINFIGTLGFSIVLPFLVFLVIDFGGNAIVYGILAAVYPAFQLIGAPILGRWSDIYGRKKVLLVSHGGTLIGWLFFLFALFLPVENLFTVSSTFFGTIVITLPLLVLFFARLIDGITGGNISVANAYLADISTDENRSKNFGKIAISSNLGFIVGPALAGILGATIYQEILPVIAALFLSSITLIVISFGLKESKSQLTVVQVPDKESVRKVFAQECKECYNPVNPKKLRFQDILKWSVTELGIFYAVLSGIMVLVQGLVLPKALKMFSEEKLVIFGSIILGTNFILFVSNDNILMYGAAILFAVGNGLMWPSFMSLLSKTSGNVYQGFIQGVTSSFGSLASIVGLTIGGISYNLIGESTFLISAGIIFVIFIMSFKLLKMNLF